MPVLTRRPISDYFPTFGSDETFGSGTDSIEEFFSATSGDIDNDGEDELICFVDGEIRVYQEGGDGRGEGGDDGRPYYTVLDGEITDGRATVTVGDIDDDGISDIVVGTLAERARLLLTPVRATHEVYSN